MLLLVLYVTLALGVSFLCSVLEAVLLKVTPYFVAALENDGRKAGAKLRRLTQDIDRPLAAILSLNTVAHTVGAAGAGAQATHVFGDAYVGAASAVLTFLILVLSEIIPKTLGARYWRRLAPWLASLLSGLVWLMWPLVKLSEFLTALLGKSKHHGSVSREEFSAMVDLGEKAGAIHKTESRLVRNLLRFTSLRAEDIMTPRTVLFTLHRSTTVGEAVARCDDCPFSRIPLHRDGMDDITGYVLRDDVLLHAARDQHDVQLASIKREMPTVPATVGVGALFDHLLRGKHNIALVVDEYGGTEGIVSDEDVVETLLGLEIVDESDPATDMRVLAREQWEQRARRLGLLSAESS